MSGLDRALHFLILLGSRDWRARPPEAARDAKSAAHAARRAQQYGTGVAAIGASIRAAAGAQVAESAANLVDAHVNLVRVAANPHADSYAQSVLVDRALAAVDLAQAQLGLLLAPENDPAALAALDEAVAATAQAKMAIDEAIASDPPLLGLEVTSWPGGCPNGIKLQFASQSAPSAAAAVWTFSAGNARGGACSAPWRCARGAGVGGRRHGRGAGRGPAA